MQITSCCVSDILIIETDFVKTYVLQGIEQTQSALSFYFPPCTKMSNGVPAPFMLAQLNDPKRPAQWTRVGCISCEPASFMTHRLCLGQCRCLLRGFPAHQTVPGESPM